MRSARFAGLFLLLGGLAAAAPDFAALQKEREALERSIERESQKIEEAQERALIPVHAKVRELQAKAERELNAASLALGAQLLGGKAEVSTAGFEQARFAVLEVANLENNQLAPEVSETFDPQRLALSHRQELAAARIEARMFEGMEGGDKAAALAIRKVEVNQQWQVKSAALERELAQALRKITLEHTTRINRVEARIAALGAKQAALINARIREKAAKGEAPTAADMVPAADPAVAAAETERDEARNTLETAIEQKRADFTPRRNELDNQREEELAKLGG